MKSEDELAAVAKVAESLAENHPEVAPETIVEIVDEEYHALDGNPVRDFVAPLVKHAAEGRIREAGDEDD